MAGEARVSPTLELKAEKGLQNQFDMEASGLYDANIFKLRFAGSARDQI